MAFTTPIFMILPNTRTHYVEISCTEFYPNRVKMAEKLAKFHSPPPEKYSLRYNHFYNTHQWSKILRENLTEISAQFWKVGYKFFYAPRYNTTLTELTFTKPSTFFLYKPYTEFHENLTNSLIVDRPTRSRRDRQIWSLYEAVMLY